MQIMLTIFNVFIITINILAQSYTYVLNFRTFTQRCDEITSPLIDFCF